MISSTLISVKKQDEGVILNAFVTFIVGPPDHPNARFALHSHLVGCHTTSNSDMLITQPSTSQLAPASLGRGQRNGAHSWCLSPLRSFGRIFVRGPRPLGRTPRSFRNAMPDGAVLFCKGPHTL